MAIRPYLVLIRPANVVTSMVDIVGGAALAGALIPIHANLLKLSIASACLYGGGIALNDCLDAELDAIERPERPIPSRAVSPQNAMLFALSLLAIGVGFAAWTSWISAMIAIAICLLIYSYNRWAKHIRFVGPVNMGMLRSLNLLLGMSVLGFNDPGVVGLIWIPLLYIAGITSMAQQENEGNNRSGIFVSLLINLAIGAFLLTIFQPSADTATPLIVMTLLWLFTATFHQFKALKRPSPQNIKSAVKWGIISLILLNSVYVASTTQWYFSLIPLAFAPISIILAKRFAVT